MSTDYEHPDPEDMFKDTRMSFGDHIEDLRTHMFRAIKGFMIGMLLGLWPLGSYVVGIIVAPVEAQLHQFEIRKLNLETEKAKERRKISGLAPRPLELKGVRIRKQQWQKVFGAKADSEQDDAPLLDPMFKGFEGLVSDLGAYDLLDREVRDRGNFIELDMEIPDPTGVINRITRTQLDTSPKRLSTMNITEAFIVYFKVALLTGLVISSPWVFYHLWMFIAAGLYPHEKKLVNVYLPFSVVLFIGGVMLCQFAVMPRAVGAMLMFNEWLGLSADLRLNEWLSFALLMPLVFGVSFQTPLVMMFLHRVGILTVKIYREYRKISWFVLAVIAVVIVPSPDAISMLFLWVPMGALYELGILLCVYQGDRPSLLDFGDEEKSNELVEV